MTTIFKFKIWIENPNFDCFLSNFQGGYFLESGLLQTIWFVLVKSEIAVVQHTPINFFSMSESYLVLKQAEKTKCVSCTVEHMWTVCHIARQLSQVLALQWTTRKILQALELQIISQRPHMHSTTSGNVHSWHGTTCDCIVVIALCSECLKYGTP